MGVLREAYRARVPSSPGSNRPLVRRGPFIVLAAALLIHNTLMFAVSFGFGALALPAAALLAGPVLLARHRPLAAWTVMIAAQLLLTGLGVAPDSAQAPQPWLLNQALGQLPVIYVLALTSARGVTVAAFVVTIATVGAVATLQDIEPDRLATGLLTWALALLVAAVLGHARRARRLATLRVAEEHGRRQVLEERARIARELHDVVAHHMSVIAVQAVSAPYRVEGEVSEEVAREFASINTAAREALRDMRHLLGALRGTDDTPQTTPQPDLNDLDRLVQSVRRAGVPVQLTIATPAPAPVLSVTVHRIVQEALSNVVRHAPGAHTTVSVRAEDGDLVVKVENEPSALPPAERRGQGHGLIGMRERVAALRGELTTATTDEGGFAVRARLPGGDRR
ncbi:sensor histidine kinase [Nonomuraea mesophila]|uniref:histidine kinase n=1 Tax=Nonomuraea mesophila TaxID=2530382 RepID=A0A4R5EWE5_9ACTN|nr:histidine kinase [Nonomuraea mesophila]TDE39328.1 sensor histidine kinase [Nonomuraea mesophila]